jgi:hypothetical protein
VTIINPAPGALAEADEYIRRLRRENKRWRHRCQLLMRQLEEHGIVAPIQLAEHGIEYQEPASAQGGHQ